MIKIKNIQFTENTATYDANFQHGIYQFKDLQMTADQGNIFLTGETTPVSEIRITIKHVPFHENARILGDTLERAYGDLSWKELNPQTKIPWYFIVSDLNTNYCFGVKTGPNAFCFWKCDQTSTQLILDLRNGSHPLQLNGRTLHLCQVVTAEYSGDSFDALTAFCSTMCDHPRLPCGIVYGGNDWYCNYGNSSLKKILEHTRRIVECSPKNCPDKPFMVIDDGWQPYHSSDYNGGPWRSCNAHFGSMEEAAAGIEQEGAIPGIWFRPLVTREKVPEDCILKFGDNCVVLDPSSPSALAIIREDIRTLKKWGFRLIKHDFSTFDLFGKWGFQMNGIEQEDLCFHDRTRTTAEIIKDFYLAIREAAGDDVLIMGCNTFSHLSAGIFELQRTGDDTSGIEWERVKKYGVNTLAFRIAQHGTFYSADADCVGITDQIPWTQNRQWLDVLAKSSTPLFISIGDNAYTKEIQDDITKAFALVNKADKPSRPMDWKETKTPVVWESVYGKDIYCW